MPNIGSPLDALPVSIRALENQAAAITHVTRLRFPNYRNLESNAILPFDFPVTVLLGRNGTNKSSILHALYGSPLGASTADFWFETKLDAIPETDENGLKQSVAHSYISEDGEMVECIKARAPRSTADPDYWEAVKPTMRYGFPRGSVRVPPITLEVLHLDFRAELPAFDKYFHFPDPVHLSRRMRYARRRGTLRRDYRKQDYLRRRSGLVRKRMEEVATGLTEREMEILRYVLERDYISGSILTHDLYHGHDGRTIRFSTRDFAGGYSDAFAGSGESAAAFLIHDIFNAPEGSLVLLDEPETSLHPRAQRRILEFVCHQAARKRLQVVMATHSHVFADALPQDAIRVLVPTENGRIRVSTTHSAREALHEVDTLPPGQVVLVEDTRAKHLVLSALDSTSPAARQQIEVKERPGGASQMFADILSFTKAGKRDVYIVFDGDHKPAAELPTAGDLPQGLSEIEEIIATYTRGPNVRGPRLNLDTAETATAYVDLLRTNVHFLPGSNPEALVWSDQRAAEIVGAAELPIAIRQERDYKLKLEKAAMLRPGVTAESLFQFLVAEFLSSPSPERANLIAMVDAIRQG